MPGSLRLSLSRARRRPNSRQWFSISPVITTCSRWPDGHVTGIGVFGPRRGLVIDVRPWPHTQWHRLEAQ